MHKMRYLLLLAVLNQPVMAATKDVNAWEMPHADFSAEARRLMKLRCERDAKEEIFAPIDNVKSIVRIDTKYPGRPFVGSINKDRSVGLSYTHPLWMFFNLGLDTVESERSEIKRTTESTPYIRFNLHTRDTEPAGEIRSRYAVKFSSVLTADEESQGLRGRKIEVIDMVSEKIIGERTEFFWVNPNSRRSSGGFVCPSLTLGQSTPLSFLSRVINSESYGCWHKTERDSNDGGLTELRIKNMETCIQNFLNTRNK